jgi:tetratricopeptide (TPR) repeat protein
MREKKLGFVLLGLLALGLVGCDQLRARDNLNKGVRAYGESDYQGATAFFEEATQLDPELTNAELYLGMAYLQQFVPGAVGPDNQRFADLAIETFQSVLQKDPTNTTAIAGLASVYQNTNRLDLARESYLRQAEISPEDPVAHYSVGSVNWLLIFSGSVVDPEEVTSLIEEGQMHLDRALELRETYEDAMSYKNLLYRQAAELIPEDTEDEEALARREELLATADEWFDRALETRQRNAELAAAGLPVE